MMHGYTLNTFGRKIKIFLEVRDSGPFENGEPPILPSDSIEKTSKQFPSSFISKIRILNRRRREQRRIENVTRNEAGALLGELDPNATKPVNTRELHTNPDMQNLLKARNNSQSAILTTVYTSLSRYYERKYREAGQSDAEAKQSAANTSAGFMRQHSVVLQSRISQGEDPLILQRDLRILGKQFMKVLEGKKIEASAISIASTRLTDSTPTGEGQIISLEMKEGDPPSPKDAHVLPSDPYLHSIPGDENNDTTSVINLPTSREEDPPSITHDDVNAPDDPEGFEEVFGDNISEVIESYGTEYYEARQDYYDMYGDMPEVEMGSIEQEIEVHQDVIYDNDDVVPMSVDDFTNEGDNPFYDMSPGTVFSIEVEGFDGSMMARFDGNAITIKEPPVKWRIDTPDDMRILRDLLHSPFGRELVMLGNEGVKNITNIARSKSDHIDYTTNDTTNYVFALIYNAIPSNPQKITLSDIKNGADTTDTEKMNEIFRDENKMRTFLSDIGIKSGLGIMNEQTGKFRTYSLFRFLENPKNTL